MHNAQYSQKEAIKEKILGGLKNEDLQVISFTDNKEKFFWEEEGKEFLFNGEMYDVVKIKIINGKKILFCIDDKKEKALVDNYNLITKKSSSSDKTEKSNIDHSINLFVYTDELPSKDFFVKTLLYSSFLKSYFPKGLADQLTPPPKA